MFNRNDLQTEIIDGFSVSANRKKLWITELDLLGWLEELCCKEKIDYFLLFGSAVGAVRHQGFIPWDDDIDLGMLREDFERFLEADKSYWPEYIDVQYGISKHGADFLLRIRDSRTTGIVRGEEDMSGNKGAFIEIYVFDNVEDNLLRKIQIGISGFLKNCISCYFLPTDGKSMGKRIKTLLVKILGMHRIWSFYDKVCKMQNGRKNAMYVDTPSLPDYAKTGQHLFYREDVSTSIYVPFEYTQVRIPKGYDRCLSTRYGNYMEMPPLDKRGTHHSFAVFYDPEHSYMEYEKSDIVKKYFAGDLSLEKL